MWLSAKKNATATPPGVRRLTFFCLVVEYSIRWYLDRLLTSNLNELEGEQLSQQVVQLLATPRTSASGHQTSLIDVSASVDVHNVKVQISSSWQMLHQDCVGHCVLLKDTSVEAEI